MDLHVENISPEANEEDLKTLFGEFGVVESVKLKRDRNAQEMKNFAFVVMPLRDEGLSALKALQGRNVKGIPISVREVSDAEMAARAGQR